MSPERRHFQGLRRRTAVVRGRAAARDRNFGENQTVRPRGDLQRGVHHHFLSERLLLHRLLRGGQGPHEVNGTGFGAVAHVFELVYLQGIRRDHPAPVRRQIQPVHADGGGALECQAHHGRGQRAARRPEHRLVRAAEGLCPRPAARRREDHANAAGRTASK